MLNQLDNLTERVRGSNKLVDRWLHVRKHLLVAYYNLVGIKPGKESYMRLNEKALDDFCQSLVDYLSAGHFSIYERILNFLSECLNWLRPFIRDPRNLIRLIPAKGTRVNLLSHRLCGDRLLLHPSSDKPRP